MRKLSLVLLMCFTITALQAQNRVFNGSQITGDHQELYNTFNKFDVFQLDSPEEMRTSITQTTNENNLRLQLGQEFDWSMELESSELFAPTFVFTVLTEDGPVNTPFNTNIAFKGKINDAASSEVRLTITDNWVSGFVRVGTEKYYIEPVSNLIQGAPAGHHVVYNSRDVVPINFDCDSENPQSRPIIDKEQTIIGNERGGGCVDTEIAMAAAFDMVGKYGSTLDAGNHIVGIMNDTEPYYVVHGIGYTVVQIVVPASQGADPWSAATCMDDLLPSFVAWGPGGFVGHDVGQLWVNRDVMRSEDGVCDVSSLIGRAAGIGTICTADRYNCCEDIGGAAPRAVLSAHELGHNWDGRHGDAVDNDDIMFPSLNSNDLPVGWSAANTGNIAGHVAGAGCLSADNCPCAPDDDNPLAWCQDITIQLNGAGTASIVASDLDVASNDDCGGVTLLASRTDFDCSHVPDHFVILTVTDGNGNQSFCGSTVTVQDLIPPDAQCKDITVQLDNGGSASVSATDIDNGSDDNCGFSLSLIADNVFFNCGDVGPNPVELTVTDDSGNEDDCISIVTVEDNVPPQAFCKNISIFLDFGTCNVSIDGIDVDNGSSDACGIASYVVVPDFFDTGDVGPNPVVLTVTDVNGNSSQCNATVTVQRRPTTLTNLGAFSGQYSDWPVLQAQLIDDLTGNPIPGKDISFTIGVRTVHGITNGAGVATATMRLYHNPALNWTILSKFEDDDPCYEGSQDEDDFDVLQEDARTTWTGSLCASTSGINSGNAKVLLSATICDISNSPDAGGDDDPGDISNATVTFYDRDGGAISPAIPVIPLPGDTTKGVVTYLWNVDIGFLDSKTFTVGTVVGNYYIRDSNLDDVEITISRPDKDFVTGGGHIILESSEGTLAGDDGTHCNFGFTAKFIRRGQSLRGESNTIFRRMEGGVLHEYQIKATEILSMCVSDDDPTAEFHGNASVTDLTDDVVVYPNTRFIVKLTDNGNPGSDDMIGIAVYDDVDGLVFSSNWSGTETLQQRLDGGNLKIHNHATVRLMQDDPKLDHAKALAVDEIISNSYPNPFSKKAVIEFTLPSSDRTTLEIVSVLGEVVHVVDLGTLDANTRYSYDFEPKGDLEVGNYLYRITAGDHIATGQMILVK